MRSALQEADQPAAPVVVAFSGGADSLALTAATVFEARKQKISVHTVTVDHGLQRAAAQVAAGAAAQARALGVGRAEIVRVQVAEAGEGVEAAARRARYQALNSYCEQQGAQLLLLAHTLNDQAEQVLLGLARGSGTRSVAGIAARRGILRRPLLDVTRHETELACAAEGLEFWRDPHNTDPRFLRARVRSEVLPQLAQVLGDGIYSALARTAKLAAADADLLDDMAQREYDRAATCDSGGVQLPVGLLESLPEPLMSRVIRLAIAQVGETAISYYHTSEVMRLITNWRGQQHLTLPKARVYRAERHLFFAPADLEPRM